MVYRLVNIPMDKIDYYRELSLVVDIAEFNGYKKYFKTNYKAWEGRKF